jgi:hypothetical protein
MLRRDLSRPIHVQSVVVCAVFAGLIAPAIRAEVRPLTLYEKVGRAPVVLWGEVTQGEARFASVRTLDLLKCTIPEIPGATLRIAFRLDSFLRNPWEDRIEFKTGEHVLLFLRKFTREDGDKPAGDLYTLMWGLQGKIVLPAEGEEAHIEAARLMSSILSTTDAGRQARMLQEAVSSANPFVADASLTEVLKQGLADFAMMPRLVALLSARREPARLLAMRILAGIFQESRVAGREVPGRQDLTDQLRARAAADSSPEMRVEAVRALEALGGEEVRAFLARLAQEDTSQLVRYEAKKALLGWKEGS